MWPFKNTKNYPDSFIMDMHKAIAATWINPKLNNLLEHDEDAGKRFIFSSFIQALVFYGPTEFDSTSGKPSERSKKVIAHLALSFLNANNDIRVGEYIVCPREKWTLPEIFNEILSINSDPSNCLDLHMPLSQLILATYYMRVSNHLEQISTDPALYTSRLHDYDLPLSPRLTMSGIFLTSAIYPSIFNVNPGPQSDVKDLNRINNVMAEHCRDLMESVVKTVKKYA